VRTARGSARTCRHTSRSRRSTRCRRTSRVRTARGSARTCRHTSRSRRSTRCRRT